MSLPEQLPEKLPHHIRKRSLFTRIVSWIYSFSIRLIRFLVLSLICIYLLFQIPQIQEWSIHTITSYLSGQLHTKVTAKRFYIDFFDVAVLRGLYVEDLKGDTLLYCDKFKMDFKLNPINLIQGKIRLDDILLENAQFNINRGIGDKTNNLQFIIDYFSKPDTLPKKPGKPLDFSVDAVALHNVRFEKNDKVKGQRLLIATEDGEIQVNKLDLPGKLIDVASVRMEKLMVKIEEFPAHPMPEPPPRKKNEPLAVDTAAARPLVIRSSKVKVSDAIFELHNFDKEPFRLLPANLMDYKHMEVYDIAFDINDFEMTLPDLEFKGKVAKMSAKEKSGFELKNLTTQYTHVNSRRIEIFGLNLNTPQSSIGDTILLKYREYPDFKDFTNKVLLEGHFHQSRVALGDIMVFAPALENNAFFDKNRNEVIQLDGSIGGKINNLNGKDLNIRIGKSTLIQGSFYSRDLAVKDNEVLNLELKRLVTDMRTLRLLIPNFNPPPNFDKLGNLEFTGRFDGFFVDFVAYGDLKTNLGRARTDMRLNLKDGKAKAQYSGNLSLTGFDLAQWADNPKFGKVTLTTTVSDGVGLTLEKASAKLNANIAEFPFRGYTYKNLRMEGDINRNLFKGNFGIKDENVDFVFDGTIDFAGALPLYDFTAKVNLLDLKDLHLSEKDFQISGDIDLNLTGSSLSNIQGKALLQHIAILKDQQESFYVDSLSASMYEVGGGRKSFDIRSEVLDASLKGKFDIREVKEAFIRFMLKNYPAYAQSMHLNASNDSLSVHQFDFNFHIVDSRNLTHLIDPTLDTLKNVTLKGSFNNLSDSIYADLDLPHLGIGNFGFDDVTMLFQSGKDQGQLDFGIYHTVLNNKTHFAPVSLNAWIDRDTTHFAVTAVDFTKDLDKMELNGLLFPVDTNYQVSFLTSNLVILNTPWTIDEDNFVLIGSDHIQTNNFFLHSGDKRIELRSIGRNGLEAQFNNFNIDFVNDLWTYDKLHLEGNYQVKIEIGDLFHFEQLRLSAQMDTLLINQDDWGILRIDADAQNLKTPVHAYVHLTKESQQLAAEGYYYPKMITDNRGRVLHDSSSLDVSAQLTRFPLSMLEYIIDNGISNTYGLVDANVEVKGPFSKLSLDGIANVTDASVTINYLRTRYYIDQANIKLSSNLIDATGNTIRDQLGNTAAVFGGITHDHFKHFGLDFRIRSDNMMILNTQKDDNKLYYGYAIGAGDVHFGGDFKQTNINVVATTGKGTRIVFPFNKDKTASQVSFIHFKNKSRPDSLLVAGGASAQPHGVNFDMQLSVTDDAEVQLVFDERAGDIIKGRGSGNLRLTFRREGEFNMYGRYNISRGEYLFTLWNVVNKPFVVQKQGGYIHWNGDPFNAQIMLDAEYKDLNTAPYSFIEEYLSTDNEKSDARKATPVELTMHMEGALLKPDITFGLGFPQLTGTLKSYAEDKLRVVRQDQNELNRQIFGLVIIGGFLPSDAAFQGAAPITGVFNTLSELITNQLSIYLNEFLSQYINDFDLGIAYNRYQPDNVNQQNINRTGDEWQVRIRKGSLFNDRVSISGGVGFERNSAFGDANSSGTFIAGNVVIEYYLTTDRRMKLRLYNSTDQVIEGRRNKFGAGISFRQEFDTFQEFLQSLKLKK